MKPQKVVPEKVRGYSLGEAEIDVSVNDCILYSLAIGFNRDQLNRDHFKFTYEHEDGFTSFPVLSVSLGHKGMKGLTGCPGLPEFNQMMLLHGEQKIDIIKPIPPGTRIKM